MGTEEGKTSASGCSEGSCCLGSGCFSWAIAISCSRATPRYYTEFTNLSGLTTGAKVRVSGLDAGEVLTIDVPDSPAARFRLRFRIDAQLRALVRSDSVVTIDREGVVGGTSVGSTGQQRRRRKRTHWRPSRARR